MSSDFVHIPSKFLCLLSSLPAAVAAAAVVVIIIVVAIFIAASCWHQHISFNLFLFPSSRLYSPTPTLTRELERAAHTQRTRHSNICLGLKIL